MTSEDIPQQDWSLFGVENPPAPPAEPAHIRWVLEGGEAHVHLAPGPRVLRRPVIISDGFNAGPSNFAALYDALERADFPFVTELHNRGYDLILLGYEDRAASILDNAKVATECVFRALSERQGDAPLAVGGFSMGGLVTRYALAKMETQRIDHQTALYFSFDSPHRGASIPLALQALAHFLKPTAPKLSAQINSPAARQLLWRHIETVQAEPVEDPLRTEFLEALKRVGGWPMRPRKIGIANGRGDGTGIGVPAGEPALECTKGGFRPTTLRTQSPDSRVVLAHLKDYVRETDVRHRGLAAADGAPGGTLDSYDIAARNLTKPLLGMEAVAHHPEICFVPSGSAVDLRDIDDSTLYENLKDADHQESGLDEIVFSNENTRHSRVTEQLGTWLLDQLPGH